MVLKMKNKDQLILEDLYTVLHEAIEGEFDYAVPAIVQDEDDELVYSIAYSAWINPETGGIEVEVERNNMPEEVFITHQEDIHKKAKIVAKYEFESSGKQNNG